MKLICSAFIFFSLTLFSCSSKSENTIIGKWKAIDGPESVEFFKDGTVSMVPKDIPIFLSGSYWFVNEDRLRIGIGNLRASDEPIIFEVSVSKNELIVIDPEGTVVKYKKVK